MFTNQKRCMVAALLSSALVLPTAVMAGGPAGTAITYQGQLQNNGSNVDGPIDFEFRLFGQEVGGTQVGATVLATETVTDGVFSSQIDFGVDPYTSDQPLWLEIVADSETLSRQQVTSAPFSLATRGVNVSATGNVGIGTTTPTTKLHITNTVTVSGHTNPSGQAVLQLDSGQAGPTQFAAIDFFDNGIGQWGMGKDQLNDFYIGNAVKILKSNNNVGIGTINPQSRLHVSNASSGASPRPDASLTIEDNQTMFINMLTGSDRATGILFGDNNDNDTGGIVYSHLNDTLSFRTNGNVERVLIDAIGNVGIGVTSPTQLLDLSGPTNPGIQINNELDANTRWNIYASIDDHLRIRDSSDGYDIARFKGVGIPEIQLMTGAGGTSVGAVMGESGTYAGAGRFLALDGPSIGSRIDWQADGTPFMQTGVYFTNSDERLKRNIRNLENPLNTLLALRGVTYQWKRAADDSASHLGFVAQEVEAVVPELVSTDADGMKSVAYANVSALLVEATREQQIIIDDQQSQIDELRSELAELQATIKALISSR